MRGAGAKRLDVRGSLKPHTFAPCLAQSVLAVVLTKRRRHDVIERAAASEASCHVSHQVTLGNQSIVTFVPCRNVTAKSPNGPRWLDCRQALYIRVDAPDQIKRDFLEVTHVSKAPSIHVSSVCTVHEPLLSHLLRPPLSHIVSVGLLHSTLPSIPRPTICSGHSKTRFDSKPFLHMCSSML